MKIKYLAIALSFAALALVGCGKDPAEPEEPAEELMITPTEQTVRPVDGKLAISMTISGLAQTKYMTIDKVTSAGVQSINYYPRVLAKEYTYYYTMLPTDEEEFRFEFTLLSVDGIKSKTAVALVDNHKEEGEPKYSRLTVSNLRAMSRVTGKENNGHDGLPSVRYTVNNATDAKYNVGGTDLGIVWEITPGYYGLFFGDTFGSDFNPNFSAPGPNGGSWRSNVLLYSDDNDLEDGLKISGAALDQWGNARQIVYSAHVTNGQGDYTSIPTAAVHANGRDYVHYFNIKTWDGWVTNYSGMYRSSDGGGTWDKVNGISWGGESFFGQVGFCNIGDGYVYMVGTQSGRDSKPKLARVVEAGIESQYMYEFWNGADWVKGKEQEATVLINDLAGELSVEYLPEFEKWVILYFNGPRYEITMRYADKITGPWSEPITVASGQQYPQLYGSFIHPLSKQEGGKLYFIMSMWLPYNTYLMSVDLKGIK